MQINFNSKLKYMKKLKIAAAGAAGLTAAFYHFNEYSNQSTWRTVEPAQRSVKE